MSTAEKADPFGPDLFGRVAMVVGGSRGIGAVTAAAYARAGARVVIAARDLAALEHEADSVRSSGGEVIAVQVDVTDPKSVRALVDQTMSIWGRLDIAFNNATDGPAPAPLAEVEPEDFDRAVRANTNGTFYGLRYQIPAMLAGGGGAIVNMASSAGVDGVANLAGYVAGKAGIIGLTKAAALDYADRGMRVNVVAPGPILTHHLRAAGPEAQRRAGAATPMGRVGQAQEVADTVLWLSSDRSSFVTGAVIPIDGGQAAGRKPSQMDRQGQPIQRPTS